DATPGTASQANVESLSNLRVSSLTFAGGAGAVQARHGRSVLEIHELRQVTVLDAIFGANVLVLMVEVFPVLGKADGGESLLVEGVMVATPQVTVETENQQRLDPGIVGAADLGDVAREFAGTRIALAAQVTDLAQLLLIGRDRDPFGENAHHACVLLGALVATHNVVVEHGLDIPALLLRHGGEMPAAVQSLLFAGDRQKNDGGWKF